MATFFGIESGCAYSDTERTETPEACIVCERKVWHGLVNLDDGKEWYCSAECIGEGLATESDWCEYCHTSGVVELAPDSDRALLDGRTFPGSGLTVPCVCKHGKGRQSYVG